jgi:hypothetical protein
MKTILNEIFRAGWKEKKKQNHYSFAQLTAEVVRVQASPLKAPPLIYFLSLPDRSLTVSLLSFKFPTLTRPFFALAPVRFFFVTIIVLLFTRS